MENRYLCFLRNTIKHGIEELDETYVTLDEFVNEFQHVEGMNGQDPTSLVNDAKVAVFEAKTKLGLLNDFVREALNE